MIINSIEKPPICRGDTLNENAETVDLSKKPLIHPALNAKQGICESIEGGFE
jgi:hypothetical protein